MRKTVKKGQPQSRGGVCVGEGAGAGFVYSLKSGVDLGRCWNCIPREEDIFQRRACRQ